MALTPGGGRSPSTKPRPDKTRLDKARPTPPRSPRSGGAAPWSRSASVAVLRLGLLVGGLVIILDLFFMLFTQHSVNADDIATFDLMDLFLNVVLFSLLGVLVVRQTGLTLAGAVAGLFAGLLDAIVITAAFLMIPPPQTFDMLEGRFVQNLVVGTLVAGVSGLVFALGRRWSGGQRPR